MLAYVSTGVGCSIREGRSLSEIKKETLREVGTLQGVKECRVATLEDICWVKGMGGWVPREAEKLYQENFIIKT